MTKLLGMTDPPPEIPSLPSPLLHAGWTADRDFQLLSFFGRGELKHPVAGTPSSSLLLSDGVWSKAAALLLLLRGVPLKEALVMEDAA